MFHTLSLNYPIFQ